MYDLTQPYSSQRSPVAADNLVAASQPLAVEAGVQAMRKGGNAVDAALSAAITLTVVEPNNNGLGSDAFCILWDGSELVGLNASGRSPAKTGGDVTNCIRAGARSLPHVFPSIQRQGAPPARTRPAASRTRRG